MKRSVRLSATLFLFSVACGIGSFARAENDLFSKISMAEVVTAEASDSDSGDRKAARTGSEQSITDRQTMADRLRVLGYEPETAGRYTTVVVNQKTWKLPTYLFVDLESDRIQMEMPLVKVIDETKLDATKLVILLSEVADHPQLSLVHDRSNKTIELRYWISNQDVNNQAITDAINRMTAIAVGAGDTWYAMKKAQLRLAEGDTKNPAATTKTDLGGQESAPAVAAVPPAEVAPVAQTKATTVSPAVNLVGTWSAKRSETEAFAIQLSAKNQFQLVHIKSGKTTVSKGTAQIGGGKLVLKGSDGTQINGLLAQKGSESFTWSLTGGDGKVVVELKFDRKS